MSTGLNTVAGTIFEDFLSPLLPASIKEERESLILKLTVVFFGVLCTLIIYVIKELGTVLEISMGLQGITAGVLLFMFTFGLTVRSGNTKGVLSGAVVGLITTGILATGANLYILAGDIVYGRKVTTIEGCPENMTLPLNLNTTRFGYPGEGTRVLFSERVPWVFRLSYLYYSVIGLAVSMAVGSVVSLATRTADVTTVAPELLIPQLRGARIREHIPIDEYSKVPTAEGQRVLLRQKSYHD